MGAVINNEEINARDEEWLKFLSLNKIWKDSSANGMVPDHICPFKYFLINDT